jgi:large subunit ribosomal protein L24e
VSKKNPRKFHWTVFFRRLHKKGTAEEVAKKRTRKTVKVQRAVVGATWEQIVAQREQPATVRKATRDAAIAASKETKKNEQANKRAEKIKSVGSAQRQQPKFKAAKSAPSARPSATSR